MRIVTKLLLSAVLFVGGVLFVLGCLYLIALTPEWLLIGFAGLMALGCLAVAALICWETVSDWLDKRERWS